MLFDAVLVTSGNDEMTLSIGVGAISTAENVRVGVNASGSEKGVAGDG